jgi:hypothetical protein
LALDPKSTDPTFEDEREAINKASELSRADPRDPIAVWDNRSDYVWLFFDGEQFGKV